MSDTPKQTIDIHALCERLGLRPAEVYREVKLDKLKFSTEAGKTVFLEADVQEFLEHRDTSERELMREADEWLQKLPPKPAPAETAPPTSDAAEGTEPPAPSLKEKTTALTDAFLRNALAQHALDLYLDPVGSGCRVLQRLAGAVAEVGRVSAGIGDALREELKGRLGISGPVAEPRSGVFGFSYEDVDYRFIGTVAPTVLGEHLHLAAHETVRASSLGTVGYSPEQTVALQEILTGSPGAFISVGPPDPAADRHRLELAAMLAEGDRLVVSLERQPRLKSETLVQLQVGGSDTTGFEAMFGAALAMSPSVLFMDDVRTPEEARAVFEGVAAGMTVVARMRAADNVEALLKLIEAGVSKSVLARDILGLSAQRVFRKVCPECRTLREVTPADVEHYGLPADASIAVPGSCPQCSDGFAGRHVFHDLWVTCPDFVRLVSGLAAPGDDLRTWAATSPLSLAAALRQAVLAGEVALADAAPMLIRRSG
jgi:type II secretory ATPase GspE/PulE/Tfp pilus assembly ATPase PilB-like protein